jgi:hypothetical protein
VVEVTGVWTLSFVVAAIVALVRARSVVPEADPDVKTPWFREMQAFGPNGFLATTSPVGMEPALTGEAPRSPDPLLRTVSNE